MASSVTGVDACIVIVVCECAGERSISVVSAGVVVEDKERIRPWVWG